MHIPLKRKPFGDMTQTLLLKNRGTEILKVAEISPTLMARDYKGFGNQTMAAVMETEHEN